MKNKSTITIICIFVLTTLLSLSVAAADGPDRKYYKKGQAVIETSDYTKAREYLNEAIERYPQYADAYYLLGRIALADKDAKAASVN